MRARGTISPSHAHPVAHVLSCTTRALCPPPQSYLGKDGKEKKKVARSTREQQRKMLKPLLAELLTEESMRGAPINVLLGSEVCGLFDKMAGVVTPQQSIFNESTAFMPSPGVVLADVSDIMRKAASELQVRRCARAVGGHGAVSLMSMSPHRTRSAAWTTR